MSLEILNSPMMATLQDQGRYGYSHLGVSVSGAMDEYACFMANQLLGNPLETNVIEAYYGNIEFRVHAETKMSVTGASCEFFINGKSLETWRSHHIKAGDRIRVGNVRQGSIVYLAVQDGFDVSKELGSWSTTLKEGIGGIGGKKLERGVRLPYRASSFSPCASTLKQIFIPGYRNPLELRIMFSYQSNSFAHEEKQKLLKTEYWVSSRSNRMGYRLEGEPIGCELDGIISEGIAFGSVQIPKDGLPIVLLKEHQTIGGYPKIGVVVDVDCFKLSQAQPDTVVRFKEIPMEEGRRISKTFYESFSQLRAY